MRILITSCCVILMLFSTPVNAKILFESKHNGIIGIYVMDDNGNDITLLTDTLGSRAPQWSPDGKQIVFTRRVKAWDSQQFHLFMMDYDGTNIRQLTEPMPHFGRDLFPSFSPDGKSILFTRYEARNNENKKYSIEVMNLESGEINNISDLGVNRPEFSPDGKHIIFTTIPNAGGAGSNVWIMDADGRHPRELLPPPNRNLIIGRWDPRWSPNGKQIAYRQTEHKLKNIDGVTHYIPQAYRYFICDHNGNNIQQLKIPKDWKSAGIDWMDNGKSIVFSAVKIKLNQQSDGTPRLYNIYKYEIWSDEITRLTNHQAQDLFIDWIDDQVQEVSSVGKLTTQWGKLKVKHSLLLFKNTSF